MNTTIEAALTAGFEKRLYQAAVDNLKDTTSPLRLNNFAYAMREVVRHLLARLAPDASVISCSWYRNETSKQNGITRRQRAIFAVQGGLSDEYVRKELGLETKDIHTTLINAIDALSKFTHIEPSAFDLTPETVDHYAAQTERAVEALIQAIEQCRLKIAIAIRSHIDDAVIYEAIRETIAAIDEIATHHCIDEVYIDEVCVAGITQDTIRFRANGTIGVELQWGSSSDLRNDQGAVMSDSFPFQCLLSSHVSEPDALEVEPNGLRVDNSDWYGRYGEDET